MNELACSTHGAACVLKAYVKNSYRKVDADTGGRHSGSVAVVSFTRIRGH
jgi:hypothetical protein